MSRHLQRLCALLCGLAAAAPGAAEPFVAQWPLTLPSPGAGAYRVELDASVYATAVSPVLDDVVVINGDGHEVPAVLQPAPAAQGQPVSRPLAWFPLPASASRRGSDIATISELAPDGSLRRIRWQPAREDAAPGAWLVDAGASTAPLQALVLDWADAGAPFERALRIEGSDDLQDWRHVPARARLLDLRRGSERLVERRAVFDTPVAMRYLRLMPGDGVGAMPAIRSVHGESAAVVGAPPLQWHALSATEPADPDGGLRFQLHARLPVTHVDIGVEGSAAARWTLSAREHDDAPWRVRVGDWLVYRIGAEGTRTPPRRLDTPSRARQWRLQRDTPMAGPVPTLRLGYRPEHLVFIAEGAPPFSLRAGSLRARRGEAPVVAALADLRLRHGIDWQPATARLGAREVLDGQAALAHAPPRDWRTWLLWGVLLLGVATVGGFALSLLRAPKPD